MLKKLALGAAFALALAPAASFAAPDGEPYVEDFAFSFEGPFGKYDQNQLQRGLQVYTEVCAVCHGLRYVPLRTLSAESGPGIPEEQVRAYAAENFEVFDEELDDFRPATPTDHFPQVTSVGAPDLSLMAKARAGFHGPYGLGINQLIKGIGGAEYIASLLAGYTGEEKEEAGVILYENTAFPGGWISMAPPLSDELVEYADGSANDLNNLSEDVAAFLMWTAEPKMMARKQAGFVGVFFLTVLSVLLYLTNKRLWAPVKGKKD
ncbi:ubiquinol-cytochrome c reductase cytochrome c1 subunit [Cribrihabitans marinus]|uniref:Cytochrome c1 n=1 Tax=Cribrihabitans marinus TaxID=1227549 RepID=A0A1H7DFZ9_9RHOB|nr:cytochrome c1 [Cribrihabitans marinus]GGH39131.1 cytochrome c [Cribrihabitans marinus]SEK00721.1 ubiquinol-cytochrome c reductase cytochrome c1 subunit [Cribrihabitans marinus]